MKRILLIALLSLTMGAGIALGQEYGYGPMMDGRGMHYGQGHMGQGQGMMADGMGRGGRMRGPGMMMHQGQGGCQPMMAGGGMMGHRGMMMGPGGLGLNKDQRQEFLNDTVKLRKSLHMLHFEYMEARRNPKTTLEELGDMEQEMLDLRKKMMKKIDNFRTQQ